MLLVDFLVLQSFLLGRRCHNLVGFSFSLHPFSIAPSGQLDSVWREVS
jgi:hypothetical protein